MGFVVRGLGSKTLLYLGLSLRPEPIQSCPSPDGDLTKKLLA